jgi:hypothetical protein
MPPHDFANTTADNVTGNGLNLAAFQFRKPTAGFLFPGGFNLRLNAGVQGKRQAIHHFRHLFARQMARLFDDLIQCHRHGEKLRRNHAGRNGEFSFPTGRGGFRQKAALIIFLEAMRHLPTAATTAGEPSALSEGRVPRAPRFWASQGVAELHPPKLAEIYSAQSPVTGMVKTTGEGARPGLIAPKRE